MTDPTTHPPASQLARRLAVAVAFLLLGSAPGWGQSTADPGRPAFDVISIKPTEGFPRNSGFHGAAGGVLNATNVTLRFLISWAYDLREDQVSGGPAWLDTSRYEILAKPVDSDSADHPESSQSQELKRLRTQSLLADRFHLVLHKDTKLQPIFVLTVARNGPKALHKSTGENRDSFSNGHHMECHHISMGFLAKHFLANQTGRSVIDQTGLDGDFDFTLDWSPDDAPPSPVADATSPAVSFPPLFLALQDQLGLKLEPQKGPVEVLVIDRIEKPAEN